MNYEYRPGQEERYATNLDWDEKRTLLTWLSGRGQDVLLIQTPYGQDAGRLLPELCAAMNGSALPAGRFVPVTDTVQARYVSAAERARLGGCPPNGEACTYTVVPCAVEGDTCAVFSAAAGNSMASPRFDAPMRMTVEAAPVMKPRLLGLGKPVFTGFQMVRFLTPCDMNYRDGDLEYQAEGFSVPITAELVRRGVFYVHTGAPPVITARNPGVKLTVAGQT